MSAFDSPPDDMDASGGGRKRPRGDSANGDGPGTDEDGATSKRVRLAPENASTAAGPNESPPNEEEEGEYIEDEPLPERPMAPAYQTHAETAAAEPAFVFSPGGADEEEGELRDSVKQREEGEEGELGLDEVGQRDVRLLPLRAKGERVAGPRDTIKKSFAGLGEFEDYDPSVKVGEGTFGLVSFRAPSALPLC
jgi:hypothetical protein